MSGQSRVRCTEEGPTSTDNRVRGRRAAADLVMVMVMVNGQAVTSQIPAALSLAVLCARSEMGPHLNKHGKYSRRTPRYPVTEVHVGKLERHRVLSHGCSIIRTFSRAASTTANSSDGERQRIRGPRGCVLRH